jgi:hypothetical protein
VVRSKAYSASSFYQPMFKVQLSGKMGSSSEAINNSPVLGILMGLLFLAPGLWALQIHQQLKLKLPGTVETRTMFAAGSLFLLMGIFLVIMSFVDDADNINAPRWVASMASSVFALAGIWMLKSAVFDHGMSNDNSFFNLLFLALLFTCFGLVVTWISLGSGKHNFEGTVSIPFVSIFSDPSELVGRLCFLPGTIILDAGALYLWLKVIQRSVQIVREAIQQPGNARSNVLATGAIVLIAAGIGFMIAAINYAQYLNRPR